MIFGSVCSGIEAASKKCAKCLEVKLLTDYHLQPSGPKGRHSYCKPCANKVAREKRVRLDSPEKRRKWLLSQRYGLTPVSWKKMFDSQNGLCAICSGEMKRPVVDHNHETGAVRSLLCHPCNIKLHAIEDSEYVRKAVAYLDKHS